MEEKEQIEFRSDEVQEILSHVPNWMIRWGITLILGLILLLLFLSWFIRYPDTITGTVILSTEQPPGKLVSQVSGYIEQITYPNESTVLKGDVIAAIKSPVSKSSIDRLMGIIERDPSLDEYIKALTQMREVGAFQTEINQLLKALVEYREVTTSTYYDRFQSNLLDQIEQNEQMIQIARLELDLMQLDLQQAREKYQADSMLFANGVIAKHDYYSQQSKYRSKRQQFIGKKKALLQLKIRSTTLQRENIQQEKNQKEQLNQLETSIDISKKAIHSAVSGWKHTHILVAPFKGTLSYLNNLTNGKYIKSQEPLFAVIPNNEVIEGTIQVNSQGYGKIQVGQKVRISLDNYPSHEFGELTAKVTKMAAIPAQKKYYLKVSLTNGMETTYRKSITYQPEMVGAASIITKDRRLIERVLDNFRQLLDQ